MQNLGPKATSVTEQGEPDGWVIQEGFECQTAQDGSVRLMVSVPTEKLKGLHMDFVRVLGPSVGVLYRQFINRLNPGPNNGPPTDFVGLDMPQDAVVGGLEQATGLIYHDARCELWLRGELGDQVIIDRDGLIYCYPDDVAFRDVLERHGVPEEKVEVLLERDYVKHAFHAENDALESQLIDGLRLTKIGA